MKWKTADKDNARGNKKSRARQRVKGVKRGAFSLALKSMFLLMLCIGLLGCDSLLSESLSIFTGEGTTNATSEGEHIYPPADSDDLKRRNYKEVKSNFEDAGFTNIALEENNNLIFALLYKDGDVSSVTINGKSSYEATTPFEPDAEVVIAYHTFMTDDEPSKNEGSAQAEESEASEEPAASSATDGESQGSQSEETKDSEPAKTKKTKKSKTTKTKKAKKKDSEPAKTEDTQAGESKADESAEPANMTVENSADLANLLALKDPLDPSVSSFASSYSGKIIEFDENIAYLSHHESYKTRWDFLVHAGNYDPNHQVGPDFHFNDCSIYDLNSDLESIVAGTNVHVIARVESYNSNTGLFQLDPIKVTGR